MAKSNPRKRQQQARQKQRERQEAEEQIEYTQVQRLVTVLDLLHNEPSSAKQLAEKAGVHLRTMSRFMKAVSNAGWPVYIRKATPSAATNWSLDGEEMVARWGPKNSNNSSR